MMTAPRQRRPIGRRVLRAIADVGCLASLLVCLGVTWLGIASSRRGYGVVFEDVRVEAGTLRTAELSAVLSAGRLDMRVAMFTEPAPGPESELWQLVELGGRVQVWTQRPDQRLKEDYRRSRWGEGLARHARALYVHESRSFDIVSSSRRLIVPAWLVPAVTAVSPSGWCVAFAKRRRRARRHRLGLCVRCGYDLRSGPEAGSPPLARCPEFGHEREGARGDARGSVASASPSPSP